MRERVSEAKNYQEISFQRATMHDGLLRILN